MKYYVKLKCVLNLYINELFERTLFRHVQVLNLKLIIYVSAMTK